MESDSSGLKPMSAKRQKILDHAFEQLRKTRAGMDPKLLNRIRRIIAGSPVLMRGLGVETVEEPVVAAPPKPEPITKKEVTPNHEIVDQAKTMEVMAKFMALNPDGIEQIKSVIKKAGE